MDIFPLEKVLITSMWPQRDGRFWSACFQLIEDVPMKWYKHYANPAAMCRAGSCSSHLSLIW